MPLSSFFTGNVPRFYEWLSNIIMTIFWVGLSAFLGLRFLSILILGFADGRAPLSILLPLVLPFTFDSVLPMAFLLRDMAWECLIGSDWRGAIATRVLGVIALGIGYWRARQVHWEWLRWFVMPAARNLARQVGDPDDEPDEELIRFLMDSEAGINKGHWIVEAGELKYIGRASGPASRFGGPGILITQEGQAVVLEKSGGVSRVVGRGITYLEPFERPTMVVKLTTQGVKLEVTNAFTRDGGVIKKIDALVFCKLDCGRSNIDRGMRFPFDDALIIKAIWDPKRSDPRGAIQNICTTILHQVISRHTLHEFFDDVEQIRLSISAELAQEANARLNAVVAHNVVVAVINGIEIPPKTEQVLWQRWEVVQDSTIQLAKAKGKLQRAYIAIDTRLLYNEADRMIQWMQVQLEQEIKLINAGTDREIAEKQAILQRGLNRADKEMELEIRLITATQERGIKQEDTIEEWEAQKRIAPEERELRKLQAENDRTIRMLDQRTKSESDRERLQLLSEGEKYVEQSGGNLRIELFTRFVRMMQLAGHEPKEDTLKELARVLLTNHSPRGTSVALRRVLYRAIVGGGPSRDDHVIDGEKGAHEVKNGKD
jgi:hypothetical protein